MKNLFDNVLVRSLATSALLSLAIGSAAAQTALVAPGYTLAADGDTTLVVLGDDLFRATSASASIAIELGFAPTEASPLVAIELDHDAVERLAIEVGVSRGDDRPSEQLTFGFTRVDFRSSKFDGKLLTARDLTRDQQYQVSVDSPFAGDTVFNLYSGGVFVGSAASPDGVAPFVVSDVSGSVEVEARSGRRGEWIELDTYSLGTSTATFASGRTVVFDQIVVQVAVPVATSHEVGHALGIHHVNVASEGVGAMTLAVE